MSLKLLLLPFFLFPGFEMMTHGGHMASFKYQFEEDQVSLEFRIEHSILDHFDMSERCENFEVATALCLANYINEKLQFNLGGDQLNFELQGAQKDQDFFVLNMKAQAKIPQSTNLLIENECFIEFDRKFANRIIIAGKKETTSYRLNRKNKRLDLVIER